MPMLHCLLDQAIKSLIKRVFYNVLRPVPIRPGVFLLFNTDKPIVLVILENLLLLLEKVLQRPLRPEDMRSRG